MKKRNTRTRRRGGTLLPVFFTKKMVARSETCSPSAEKPLQVVESWKRRGFPVEIHEPTPVTVDELALVHDRSHVVAILEGRKANGFGNCSPEVAASLPYTTGAMLSAARHVIRHRGVAVAPVSGFHHARHRLATGYCTFNGLMVTAAALRKVGLVKMVGIIDCDMHHGDGTDEIIDHIGAHGWIRHFSAGFEFGSPEQVDEFFERLPREVAAMSDCDVILCQLGADPSISDPLGGWLETGQLAERDRIVFQEVRRLGIPLVWNLAGGYQVEADGTIPRVLEIHDNTAKACVEAYGLRS